MTSHSLISLKDSDETNHSSLQALGFAQCLLLVGAGGFSPISNESAAFDRHLPRNFPNKTHNLREAAERLIQNQQCRSKSKEIDSFRRIKSDAVYPQRKRNSRSSLYICPNDSAQNRTA